MKVLIVGHGKTGTTALLHAVKTALRIDSEVFEPPALGFENDYEDVVVKYLVRSDSAEYFDRYDRVIFIVRNGYDSLISNLLFKARFKLGSRSTGDIRRYAAMVRDVRRGRCGVVDLARHHADMFDANPIDGLVRQERRLLEVWRQAAGHGIAVRYEDFVDGGLAQLEDYLGVPIASAPTVKVGWRYSRVSRSRRNDNWRGWISPADMDELGPRLAPFHDAFGYHFDRSQLGTMKIPRREAEGYIWKARWAKLNARKARALRLLERLQPRFRADDGPKESSRIRSGREAAPRRVPKA